MFQPFPEMLDKPDSHAIGGGLAYCLAAFLILPFFLLFFAVDIFTNEKAMSWVEIGFHGISFLVSVLTFWEYLADGLRIAKKNLGKFCLITGLGTLACLVVWIFYYFTYFFSILSAYGVSLALPIVERNLLHYPAYLFISNPLPMLLCVTVLAPVSVSCLYYGSAFAPGCYNKPWLGYLLVTVMIALPRLANGLMFRWDAGMELYVFASQLPIHLIACWCYQQTDSVWSPIVIHTVTNFMGSLAVIILTLTY